ncbi:MAG: hypothetical protein ACOVO9_03620 [Bacteroidia bacterium]
MHTNKLAILILICIPFFSIGAKPPGYLGKKTMIGAYICYMPDYFSLRHGDDPRSFTFKEQSLFMPNFIYNFQASRVVANKVDLSLQTSFLRYGLVAYDEFNMDPLSLNNGNKITYSRSSGFTSKIVVRVNTDFQAPIGNYFGLGLGFLNQNVEMLDQFNNSDQIAVVNDMGICYETGTRRHIGSNLFLDLGLEGTFFLNGYGQKNDEYYGRFKEFTLASNRRIYARRNLANFKLGLNYIF